MTENQARAQLVQALRDRAAEEIETVKPGRVSTECGALYGKLFSARHEADYDAMVRQTTANADAAIQAAERVVTELLALIPHLDSSHREP